LPINVGINVKRLRGLDARELANRYSSHFASCINQIAKTFDSEFNELARKIRENPKYFEDTQNLPLQVTEHGPVPSLTRLPMPHGPAGDVNEPEFPDRLTGYRYQKLTHQKALIKSGKYKVMVNGVPQEYTFEICGPEID